MPAEPESNSTGESKQGDWSASESEYDDEIVEDYVEDESDFEPDVGHVFNNLLPSSVTSGSEGKDEVDEVGLLFAKNEKKDVQFLAVKPFIGSIVAPSDPPKNVTAPPDARLELEWVYGYRCRDSRGNLVYNSRGNLVYPVAGVVVVYDPIKKQQTYFRHHTDDVICLAQNPANPNVVATGQVAYLRDIKGTLRATKPIICVWDSTALDKEPLIIRNAHYGAVRSVSFSDDGKYLASVGNDKHHSVRVWDAETGELLAEEKGDTKKIYQVRWNHADKAEFVTVGKRHICMWSFEGKGRLSKTKARSSSKCDMRGTYYCVAFSEKGYPCVGGNDGAISIFKGGSCVKTVDDNKGPLFVIERYSSRDGGGLVTGGADKIVRVLDNRLRIKKELKFRHKIRSVYVSDEDCIVGTIGAEIFEVPSFAKAKENDPDRVPTVRGHFDGEVWGAAFDPVNSEYFISAGEDNQIYKCDIKSRRQTARGRINPKRKKRRSYRRLRGGNKASTTSMHAPSQMGRAVAISPDGADVAVGTNEGTVNVFKVGDLRKVVAVVKANKRNTKQPWIQTLEYSPDGNWLAAGTHGCMLHILDVNNEYKVVSTSKKHNAVITHLDWTADSSTVRSTCAGYELLFHSVDNRGQLEFFPGAAKKLRDEKWASQRCHLGWGVTGIFDPRQDGSDINCVDRHEGLLATGDDYGHINLFRYPAASEFQAKSGRNQAVIAQAHSSHVANVRFSPDGTHLISAGGGDMAVMQWRVVHEDN